MLNILVKLIQWFISFFANSETGFIPKVKGKVLVCFVFRTFIRHQSYYTVIIVNVSQIE